MLYSNEILGSASARNTHVYTVEQRRRKAQGMRESERGERPKEGHQASLINEKAFSATSRTDKHQCEGTPAV